MSRSNIIDLIAILLLVAVWTVYLVYDGHTPLDINQSWTLPLMIALEFTAIFLVYGIWRYHAAKGDKRMGMGDIVDKLYAQSQDEALPQQRQKIHK